MRNHVNVSSINYHREASKTRDSQVYCINWKLDVLGRASQHSPWLKNFHKNLRQVGSVYGIENITEHAETCTHTVLHGILLRNYCPDCAKHSLVLTDTYRLERVEIFPNGQRMARLWPQSILTETKLLSEALMSQSLDWRILKYYLQCHPRGVCGLFEKSVTMFVWRARQSILSRKTLINARRSLNYFKRV